LYWDWRNGKNIKNKIMTVIFIILGVILCLVGLVILFFFLRLVYFIYKLKQKVKNIWKLILKNYLTCEKS
jgi:hypothetical protein